MASGKSTIYVMNELPTALCYKLCTVIFIYKLKQAYSANAKCPCNAGIDRPVQYFPVYIVYCYHYQCFTFNIEERLACTTYQGNRNNQYFKPFCTIAIINRIQKLDTTVSVYTILNIVMQEACAKTFTVTRHSKITIKSLWLMAVRLPGVVNVG